MMDRIVDARNLNENYDENLKWKILVIDYLQDSSLDFEPVRRSILKCSHRATYCCAFWSGFCLKIIFVASILSNNLKQKITTKNALEYLAFGDDLMMDRIVDARNLNENHDENLKWKILVKDYLQDYSLDFEPVRRSILKRSHRATHCCAFWSRIFFEDYGR